MNLEGKKVFITGGCSGMGRAVADRAIAGGSLVTIFDFAPKEKMDKVQKELGENCFMYQGDVTNAEDVAKGVAYAVEKMGGLTSAVNCAGGGRNGDIDKIALKDFDFTVKLCLYGVFHCLREEIRYMKENGGSIVNFSSLAADFMSRGGAAYSAAKAGVNALTQTAAIELGKYNIRVNAVRPGLIATEKMAPAMAQPGYTEKFLKDVPIKRPGLPEDVANYVIYLLGDESTYLTGTLTQIDGGCQLVGMPQTLTDMEDPD